MDNILRSMIMDTKECIYKPELVDNILDRDEEVNKLSYFIFKVLKSTYTDKNILKSIGLDELGVLRYWDLAISLEKIGDRTKNIASMTPKLKEKHRKKIFNLLSNVEDLYKDAMNAFHTSSEPLADSVSIRRHEVIEEIKTFTQKSDCDVCPQIAINAFNMMGHINDIVRTVRFLRGFE